jgi:Domain of unknown function (DUF4290)
MQYNTERGKLIIKEYGRHIQKVVSHIMTVEDREKRNQLTKSVIELMGMLFPHLKNVEDFRHKLWDHLFVMSEFKLDVDSPYPIPTAETLIAKPNRLKYPRHKVKFRHYGHNVEVLINKALTENDEKKKEFFAESIATVMKMTYRNWNNEDVNDDTIKDDLRMMSEGVLSLDDEQRIQNMQLRNDFSKGVSPQNNRRNFGGNNRRNNNNNNRSRNNNNQPGNNNGGNGGNQPNNNRRNNNNNNRRFNNNRPNNNIR